MARMKDILHDLQTYEMLTIDEQKVFRETHNLTTTQIKNLLQEVK